MEFELQAVFDHLILPLQVEICQVNEAEAYVKLLEYNGIEGMILAMNTTKKRVKNVRKLLRLGTEDCMQVISLEFKDDRWYIDLSKRTLQVKEVEIKKKQYDRSKIVHLILRLTAHNLQCKLIDLYEDFAWDLYDKFDHAYDAFKLCLS